jgi:glucose-1-phosphate thymidylyltransferase
MTRKGILLAGGTGSRLWPITLGTSKQLLPIYDKPMVYYPLSVLMLSGIREVAIITTPEDQPQFQRLLGDGGQWGMQFTWIIQDRPEGLAQAYLLARDFLKGAPSAMVLGDNIFFGHGLPEILARANAQDFGGTVFGYHVADPERYGVAMFDADGRVTELVEKPAVPRSNFAITGLSFLDGRAPDLAAGIKPSARGELEIVDLLEHYRAEGSLQVERMGRGFAWLDTGTPGSLLEAGNFVRTLEERQGMQVGSPDEIAYRQDWIDRAALADRAQAFAKSSYGQHLAGILRDQGDWA